MWDDPIMIKHHNISIWHVKNHPSWLPTWIWSWNRTAGTGATCLGSCLKKNGQKISEGKAQNITDNLSTCWRLKSCHLKLRALSSGCWISSLGKLFHRKKNENTNRINLDTGMVCWSNQFWPPPLLHNYIIFLPVSARILSERTQLNST